MMNIKTQNGFYYFLQKCKDHNVCTVQQINILIVHKKKTNR